jgi:putative transposase
VVEQVRSHLDEMDVRLNGEMVYLWRTGDHEGEVLESYVTRKRDKSAALHFMKKAQKHHGLGDKIVTDGLRSYLLRCKNWTMPSAGKPAGT